MTFDELPECIPAPVLAKYLSVNQSTVYRLCRSGKLPSITFGNSVRVRKEVLREWIAEQEKETTAR